MKRVNIQLKGKLDPISMNADSAAEDPHENALIVRDKSGGVVGRFQLPEVTGWWLDESTDLSVG